MGDQDDATKVLKGFGGGGVRTGGRRGRCRRGTYRAVYTVKYADSLCYGGLDGDE